MPLLELLSLLHKHLKLAITLPIVFAVLVGIYAYAFMPDTYTATTSMYVLAKQDDETNNSSLYNDLNSSQMITNDVADLLQSARVTKSVAEKLGYETTEDFNKDYEISVSSSSTSRVIDLSVESKDPEKAAEVSKTISEEVSAIAQEVMNINSVNIIDEAEVPDKPSGPRRTLYVAIAALAGFCVAMVLVVLDDMLNTKLRSEEEIEDLTGMPIMGRVPRVSAEEIEFNA